MCACSLLCRPDIDGAALQSGGGALQQDIAGTLLTLDDDLCVTVEGRNAELLAVLVFRVVGTGIGGVTIPCADDAAVAFNTEGQGLAGIRNDMSFGILQLDGDDGDIPSVGSDAGAVALHDNPVGRFGGLYRLREDALAVLIAYGNHLARLVDRLPLQVSVLGHLLTTQFLAIDRQLHLVAVAVCPYLHFLTLMTLQVPVGEDMQGGLVGPP